MARIPITINSIYDGFMPTGQVGQAGQYLFGLGIDPDMPSTDEATDTRASAAIRPVSYQPFSAGKITSYPIAIINTPKTTLTYVVLANGQFVSYDSNLDSTSETLLGTSTTGSFNGAWYYNNYIYLATGTDVDRYGPLDGTAAYTTGVWTSATLGTLTALVNTAYPSTILNVQYLNHFGFTHIDGQSYFLDFNAGVGYVHKISTTKTTYEGDTNSTSSYAVLDLPKNNKPITACSYGNDIVVSATPATNSGILQGKATLFFWDTTSDSFYKALQLPDAICTVLKYIDGVLYGLSGDLNGGYRLWQYVGGDTVQSIKVIENGHLPLQGAADSIGTKIAWGADTTDPMDSSGLLSYGSKSDLLPRGLHHIGITSFS